MKKVFLALSLTLFVGTVAMANYSSSDNTIKTEVEKKEKKKKKKKKKSKKKKCASSSCCSKSAA